MVHLKTLFQGSNIFKKGLGRLSSKTMKIWSFFIEENDQTSHWGFDRSSWGSTCSLAVRAFNALEGYRCFNWTSTGGWPGRRIPRPGREGYWKRECVFNTPWPGKGNRLIDTLADWLITSTIIFKKFEKINLNDT